MSIRSKPLAALITLGLAAVPAGCGSSSGEDAPAARLAEGLATAEAACDLTGTWATKIVIPVTWSATLGIQAGSGEIVQYTMDTRAQTGTSFTDAVKVCGITSPDYKSRPIFGGELYGVRFPDSLFDAGDLPVFTAHGALSEAMTGATYSLSDVLVLLGATMTRPLTDPWPAAPGGVNSTLGSNGKPGITVLAAAEPGYSFPPVNLTRTRRAASFQIAIRNVGSSAGTVETCDRLTGSATVAVIAGKPAIDNHVIGCTRTDNADCEPRQYVFIDSQNPVFSPSGAGTVVSVRLPDGATCADVRTASF